MAQAASLGFLLVPLNVLAFRDVPANRTNNASALINPAYTNYAHHLAAGLGSTPNAPVTLAHIYQGAVQQATLLSYLHDFKTLGVIFLALLPLLLWVRPGTGGNRRVAAH
ncbi:MAG: hypothetical protein WBW93_18015 [Steroidobacteraceae bacterium]